MKPSFIDLTPQQQATFGNGCSLVPDFHYTASCRHHDFNYIRGGGLADKVKADWDMCRLMWADSRFLWHYCVTIIYWLGLTFLPFPYFFFKWSSRYLTKEEILMLDRIDKIRRGII
jgi:hypothetical protein